MFEGSYDSSYTTPNACAASIRDVFDFVHVSKGLTLDAFPSLIRQINENQHSHKKDNVELMESCNEIILTKKKKFINKI